MKMKRNGKGTMARGEGVFIGNDFYPCKDVLKREGEHNDGLVRESGL